MKKLVFKKPTHDYHSYQKEDIQRIVSVCARKGYELSEQDAMLAWEKYSEDHYCAGWLILPKEDEQLFNDIMKVMEEEK